MQWSKIKKLAEELICPALQGRVQFHLTSYRMDTDSHSSPASQRGRGWITVDGAEVLNLPGGDPGELFESPRQDLYSALREYPRLAIDDALGSPNVVTRSLAMIDRRLGKRRLMKIDAENEHELVRTLHRLRCSIEGIGTQQEAAPGERPDSD